MELRLLAVGDVVAPSGCDYLCRRLPGLIKKARDSMESQTDNGRKLFLQSLIHVYEAIGRYLLRYAEAAECRGMPDLA